MKIGERLAALMEDRGISEGELGRRSGVNQPTIHRIITSESKNPRQENVEKIAKALGVSSDWLWNGGPQQDSSNSSKKELATSHALLMFDELELLLHNPLDKKPDIPDEQHVREITNQIKTKIQDSNKALRDSIDKFLAATGPLAPDLNILAKIDRPRVMMLMVHICQAAIEGRLTDDDVTLLQGMVDRLSR